MRKLQNYINGRWRAPSSRKWVETIDPATRRTLALVPRSNQKDVNEAVKAARQAFKKWRLVPAPKRAELLQEAADLIKKNKEKFGKLCAREMGKVMPESLGDVQEAVDLGYYMAGEGRRMHGQTMPSELQNKSIKTIRQPIGVFALVTPWNFPFAIPAWKIFPALVAGNTVVFKPSQYVSWCAYELVKVFDEVGIPKGVLNLVLGKGSETGEFVINHKGIDAVSFTGSTAVGKHIGKVCGEKLKNHSLEMGGKNVIVVMDDANLDLAVDGCIWGGFGTSGQRCTAASRVLVHKNVYKEFLTRFLKRAQKLKLGPGTNPKTDVGPVINEDQLKKIESYMQVAKKQDKVRIMCGGKRASGKNLDKGFFFEPTIFAGVKPKHRVAQEEIFGPVVSVIKVSSFKEAIKVANGVNYGLSSAIFTQDVNKAETAARDLETALVYVNSATIGAEIQSPFGGLKDTGNGHREAGGLGGALESYTEWKVINVDFSGKLQKAQSIDWGK